MALAREIVERRDLHDLVVVTSGLTIALALEPAVPRITVLVTGGTLRPLQHSLVNPFAAPMIASLRLDAAFIGCNGIHPVDGVTNLNLPDAEIKRLAMGASRRSILLADASKLGRTDLAVIAGLSSFERLVTAGPSEHHGALAAAGLVIDDAGLAPEPVGLASDAGLVPAPARLIDDADPAPAARLAAGPADKLGR
jgi:DeoR family transcriptional regulator of aga operon